MSNDDVQASMPTHAELVELMDPGALAAEIERAFPRNALRSVQISLVDGTSSCQATYCSDGSARTPLPPNPTGCITKLLTMILARMAIAAGLFELDDAVAPLLDERCTTSLEGVTVRHLLEHTHGLDDSSITRAPVGHDGFIDVRRLQAQLLQSSRLAEPGLLYSYSNAGAWLVAAVLERAHSARFETLLRTRLFDPIGAEIRFRGEPLQGFAKHEICPATGNDLAISAEDVTKLLRTLTSGDDEAVAFTDRHTPWVSTTPLPGWHSVERGIRLGWKDYGTGWLGHNSEHMGAPALLRVHPQWRVGLFISAASPSPMSICATLFRHVLPGIVGGRMPKLLRGADLDTLDTARYAGRYANSALEVELLREQPAPLQLRAYRKHRGSAADDPFFVATLHAAQWEVFFPLPADAGRFPFMQFVEPTATQGEYLWNGKVLWPRVR